MKEFADESKNEMEEKTEMEDEEFEPLEEDEDVDMVKYVTVFLTGLCHCCGAWH